MATAYLLCGLPASGKTSLARRLESELGAIRFTLDERMRALREFDISSDSYGERADSEKLKIWEESKIQLGMGRDVILDWSLWNQTVRKEWVSRVTAAGYCYKLYYLQVPLKTLRARLLARNADPTVGAQHIPIAELERFSKLFERPSAAEERLEIEIISSAGS